MCVRECGLRTAKAVMLVLHGHGAYIPFEFLALNPKTPGAPKSYNGSWVQRWNQEVCSIDAWGRELWRHRRDRLDKSRILLRTRCRFSAPWMVFCVPCFNIDPWFQNAPSIFQINAVTNVLFLITYSYVPTNGRVHDMLRSCMVSFVGVPCFYACPCMYLFPQMGSRNCVHCRICLLWLALGILDEETASRWHNQTVWLDEGLMVFSRVL